MAHKRSLQGKLNQVQRSASFEEAKLLEKAFKLQKESARQIVRKGFKVKVGEQVFVVEGEFRDRLIGETVCRADPNDVACALAIKFGESGIFPDAVPMFEQGLVLDAPLREL
jgi:hypothetical protein